MIQDITDDLPQSSSPPVTLRLTGPHLTLDAVERFSLLIPGRITAIDWIPAEETVDITCPDGLPDDMVMPVTEIAAARGWKVQLRPVMIVDGQTPETL